MVVARDGRGARRRPLRLWPWLRKVDPLAGVDPADITLLQGVAILEPLSRLGLEHLARSAHRLDLRRLDTAVRQGESGDSFFVVAAGSLMVSQNGREVRRLGPGDSFGEIALLDIVPRTASVTATESSQLLRIDSASFVAAVTGQRHASLAAGRTIENWRTTDSARGDADGG